MASIKSIRFNFQFLIPYWKYWLVYSSFVNALKVKHSETELKSKMEKAGNSMHLVPDSFQSVSIRHENYVKESQYSDTFQHLAGIGTTFFGSTTTIHGPGMDNRGFLILAIIQDYFKKSTLYRDLSSDTSPLDWIITH
ncbi:MAG: hypothetical protein GC181_10255 [Bacteroidetes bacterium]|nr:hypothetical protein [Bacteroidota bacterium]